MKKIILLSALLLGAVWVSAQETKEEDPKKQAIITFTETIHDFGTIPYGGDGKWDFEFKNTGKIPLVVANVNTSCGCTVPEWTREAVAKGKTGKITAIYDTKRIGPFTKTLTVSSNAGKPVTLTIKGTVSAPVQQ